MTYQYLVPEEIYDRIEASEILCLIVPANKHMQCMDTLALGKSSQFDYDQNLHPDSITQWTTVQIDHIWHHEDLADGLMLLSISIPYHD